MLLQIVCWILSVYIISPLGIKSSNLLISNDFCLIDQFHLCTFFRKFLIIFSPPFVYELWTILLDTDEGVIWYVNVHRISFRSIPNLLYQKLFPDMTSISTRLNFGHQKCLSFSASVRPSVSLRFISLSSRLTDKLFQAMASSNIACSTAGVL